MSQPAKAPTPATESADSHLALKLLVPALALAYGLAFPWLFNYAGTLFRVFSLSFICLAGWVWGLRGGLLVALLNIPYNLLLHHWVGVSLAGGFLGPLAAIAMGGLVGMLSDLRRRLSRELRHSRQVEGELKLHQENLLRLVEEGSQDLIRTNEKLRQDVAERLAIENELIKAQDKFQKLFTHSPLWVTLSTLEDGVYLDVNDAFCATTGYTREDVLGKSSLDMDIWFDPADRSRAVEIIRQEGALRSHEICFRHKSGEPRYGLWSAQVLDLDGRECIISVMRDITKRRQAEQALRYSEERFRLLTEESPLGISMIDPAGNYIYLNPKFTEMFGYTLEDIVDGRTWFNKAFPDESYRNEVMLAWRQDFARAGVGEARPRSFKVRCKYGASKIIDFRPVTTSAGYQFIIYQDITDRILIEEALSESEQRYRQIFQESPMPMFMQDFSEAKTRMDELAASGIGDLRKYLQAHPEELHNLLSGIKHVFVNQATLDLYEAESEEDMLVSLAVFAPPGNNPHYIDQLVDFYTGHDRYEGSGQNKTLRGNIIEVLVKKVIVPGHEKNLSRVLTTVSDLTAIKKAQREKEKLESQLRQSQKMEAIGTLAGGIAHDFNNILSIIMGYAELIQFEKGKGQAGDERVDHIIHAAVRARKLVKQLLTFSRMSEADLKPTDINHLVTHTVEMLRHTIPKMVDIKINLAGKLGTVRADATQMEQVIINLASNACDAMPDGGQLVFETEPVFLDEDFAKEHLDLAAGRYVQFSVTDTGQGMDQKTLAKIYDPFFTTKGIGKGTGLGLSTVYGIIKEHGGHITCYSEPGVGTSFKVYLPVFELGGEIDEEKSQPPATAWRGEGTILLVDDEDAIRGFGKDLLESLGFKVLTAASGEDALELFKESRQAVDLAILDLGMPGMGGRKCLEELLAITPELKILVASGYSAEGKINDTLQKGAKGYVAKPFQRSELIEKLRAVMGS